MTCQPEDEHAPESNGKAEAPKPGYKCETEHSSVVGLGAGSKKLQLVHGRYATHKHEANADASQSCCLDDVVLVWTKVAGQEGDL